MLDIFLIFLQIAIPLFIGISWGWNAREAVAKKKIDKIFQEIEEHEEQEVVRIVIEKHNDILFAYNEKDSRFITQANTRQELEDNLRKAFPGKKFGCSEQNLKEIGFIS